MTIYTTHTKKMFRQIVSKYLKKKKCELKENSTPPTASSCYVVAIQEEAGREYRGVARENPARVV